MSELHLAYLSLGSNIEPEVNLPKAVKLLSQHGEFGKISSAWETKPVGGGGGNYLNACLSYKTPLSRDKLKNEIIHPIESDLGRKRTQDKNAPRTIDIDIVLFDDEIVGRRWLAQVFVVVPLAEIYPDFQNPNTNENIAETATRLRREFWTETRQGVLLG
ncbi:MAG TPA: 2-amino-4-hydroxy-6-hydroxymethyldihydropteridine diphosphokinase [Anaerolineales bacterium]|nr:2-amino-4-hydroxy-6-hydroxymethyldihydropteridine diphosphokinase [Anaerolineales bacterium]HNQ94859.1 2-amino-4-hydroxy-6-hydroxymethyldihydropteridine diphosphokinase [Anaerolineales bacterium]HNS61193.1 2-amino-4-hydroxy-6-hydroxymethyldihydropteridine diphosphokinase [Anaerolineales bacterium]